MGAFAEAATLVASRASAIGGIPEDDDRVVRVYCGPDVDARAMLLIGTGLAPADGEEMDAVAHSHAAALFRLAEDETPESVLRLTAIIMRNALLTGFHACRLQEAAERGTSQ